MSNYLPGPWYYKMDVFNGMLQGYDVYQVGGEQVVGCEGIDMRLGAEQAEANARLIATAPEMIQMLIDLRDELRMFYSDEEPYNNPRLNEVIAKAIGESP